MNNQKLTVRQQQLSKATQEVGSLSELAFVKKVVEFKKIREVESEYVGEGLAMIFVKVANLLGLKDPIGEINKQDIREMIELRFSGLSFEEIDYAFKMERYGSLGEKTQHYQLFNSEYVSTVLNKYRKWVQKIRVEKNISLSKREEEPKMSKEQKQVEFYLGVINAFEIYKETGRMPDVVSHIYDHFYPMKVFPHHDAKYRESIQKRALASFEGELMADKNRTTGIKKALEQFQGGKLKIKCKKIILTDWFKELIKKGEDIKKYLK